MHKRFTERIAGIIIYYKAAFGTAVARSYIENINTRLTPSEKEDLLATVKRIKKGTKS